MCYIIFTYICHYYPHVDFYFLQLYELTNGNIRNYVVGTNPVLQTYLFTCIFYFSYFNCYYLIMLAFDILLAKMSFYMFLHFFLILGSK